MNSAGNGKPLETLLDVKQEVKEEPMDSSEEHVDHDKQTMSTYVLSNGKSVDVLVHFNENQLSLSESGKIGTLSEFSLMVEEKDLQMGQRDIVYDVEVVLYDFVWDTYELRQRLYSSTRLRLGHLFPSEVINIPVAYPLWNAGQGGEGGAVCTLTIHLRCAPREMEMRQVCGTVEAGGTTLACSREILALHSSNVQLFYPVFTPRDDESLLNAFTLMLATIGYTRRRKVVYEDLEMYSEFARVCYSYGLSRSIRNVRTQFDLGNYDVPAVLKLSKNFGGYANMFLEPYLQRFQCVGCLQKMFADNQKDLSPSVTAVIFEAMAGLAMKVQFRPQVDFYFKEGTVRVQILADVFPGLARELMKWLHDRDPAILNRKRKSGVPFRTAVPVHATSDSEDPEGRKLRITHFVGRPHHKSSADFYEKPYLLAIQMKNYARFEFEDFLRFTRESTKFDVVGVVTAGEQYIKNLTELTGIDVADVTKFTIEDPLPCLEPNPILNPMPNLTQNPM